MVRLFAAMLVVVACASCGDSGGSGAAGEGGDGDAGGAAGLSRTAGLVDPRTQGMAASRADCVAFDACGGDPDGTWDVASICFFDADPLLGQIVLEPACSDLLQDVIVHAAGSYKFEAGQLSQDVLYALDLELGYDADCIELATAGTASDAVCDAFSDDYLRDPSFIDASCALDGDACTCTLMTADREFSGEAEYAVTDDQVDFGGGLQDFCIDGDRMQVRVLAAGLDGILTLSRR